MPLDNHGLGDLVEGQTQPVLQMALELFSNTEAMGIRAQLGPGKIGFHRRFKNRGTNLDRLSRASSPF